MAGNTDFLYDVVTNRIIAALEAGTVPWRKPWDPTTGFPRSTSTKSPYHGINVLLLGGAAMEHGYESPWWGTFNNLKAHGGSVRKGAKTEIVVFWKRLIVDDKNNPGEKRIVPMLRYFRVLNVEQCDWPDGLPPRFQPEPQREHEPIEACQALIDGYITNGPGPKASFGSDRACYIPALDRIEMPALAQFHSPEAYYGTFFHEMVHSTGHASRLKRDGVVSPSGFGSHDYSKEELVAEMGAAMLCAIAGIDDPTIDQSAAYIANWLSALRNDRKLLIAAGGQATRAVDVVRGIVADEAPEVAEVAA